MSDTIDLLRYGLLSDFLSSSSFSEEKKKRKRKKERKRGKQRTESLDNEKNFK